MDRKNSWYHEPFAHSRLYKSEDTDPSLIDQFKQQTKMVHCPSYNCTMSVEACRERRKRARLAKKIVAVNYRDLTMISQVYLELKHCTKCPGM